MKDNNNVVVKGIVTGTFVADTIGHTTEEYIGAPCGLEDNTAKGTYLEQLEHKYQEQLTKEIQEYKDIILHIMEGRDISTYNGEGLYSNLSNININKGQEDMFSYTNNCPAANPWEELNRRQKEDKSLGKKVQGSKPSDSFEAFEKFTDKLVCKNKTYRPLPDCLTIKESSIDGLGVFATEDIHILGWKDPHVWKTHTYISYEDSCGNKVKELLRSALGGYLNHSSNPNCTIKEFYGHTTCSLGFIVNKYSLVPLRDIEANEEITVNYNDCLCGLSGYDGADFLTEDKLEDRIYETVDGIRYYYNSIYGKFESTYGTPNNNPIFYTPEDAEKFLKRVE